MSAQGLISPVMAPARNAVALLDLLAPLRSGSNRPSGLSKTGLILVVGLEDIDRMHLHQRLEALRQRGFLPPPTGPKQVEDLLALLQPLRRVAEEGDDALDRLLHAVEFGEGGIDADGAVS